MNILTYYFAVPKNCAIFVVEIPNYLFNKILKQMAKIVTLGEIMLRLSPMGNDRFIQSESFHSPWW